MNTNKVCTHKQTAKCLPSVGRCRPNGSKTRPFTHARCQPLPSATMPWVNVLLVSTTDPTTLPSTVPVTLLPTTSSLSVCHAPTYGRTPRVPGAGTHGAVQRALTQRSRCHGTRAPQKRKRQARANYQNANYQNAHQRHLDVSRAALLIERHDRAASQCHGCKGAQRGRRRREADGGLPPGSLPVASTTGLSLFPSAVPPALRNHAPLPSTIKQ